MASVLTYVFAQHSMSLSRLSDLKEGHCSYGLLYNQVACCSGLDLDGSSGILPVSLTLISILNILAGEICTEWHSWSQTLRVRSLLAQSLLQSFVYMALAVKFLHGFSHLNEN
jgi:chloride channel 3/4/5